MDNVKGALIIFVILGHTLGQMTSSVPGGKTFYTAIYLFHMPAFVLLSGVLSAATLDGRRAKGLVQSLLMPYVIFQVLYMAHYGVVGPGVEWSGDRFLTPLYHLWFLVALFAWRLLAPVFKSMRATSAISISVCVSLAAGQVPVLGTPLALSRIAAMLPLFVIGLCLDRRQVIAFSPTILHRCLAAGVLLTTIPMAYFVNTRLGLGWVYWSQSYHHLGSSFFPGVLIRLALLSLALVFSTALFLLIPRRTFALTTVGERSMTPFLLHGFVVLVVAWFGIGAGVDSIPLLAAVVAAVVIVTFALSSRVAVRLFRPLVSPRIDWLFGPASFVVKGSQRDSRR